MDSHSREFQVFIKPCGPRCNLGCTYCYYPERPDLFKDPVKCMTDELLETYIRQHISASTEPVIPFSWHGGEPLLAGLDFYRRAVILQKKYIPTGSKIMNGIQTNGTLLDDNWCRFFRDENFSVGISLDGPAHFHNLFRISKSGRYTFREVMEGYDRLLLHDIVPEILCVVHSENVKDPLGVYRYFRQLGAEYITFIPLVEKDPHKGLPVSQRSVNPEYFGIFLCTIFDEWKDNDIGKIKVQIFEEAIRTAFKQEHTLCVFKPVCGGVPVVEHNGDFYSCDHFVNPEGYIGNIKDANLADLLESGKQNAFGLKKMNSLPGCCRSCNVLGMCNGECPKNRFTRAADGDNGLNYLCKGYYMFFNHCLPFVEAVAHAYSNGEEH